jgi:hypothetical protein
LLSPTEAQLRESAAVRAELEPELTRHAAFMRERIAPLQAELGAAGQKPIDLQATPPPLKEGDHVDEHGSRSEDE